MAVQFRVLGATEVRVDGRPIPIGYAQLQCVLAVLLVEVNRPVSIDNIVDRVWGTRRLPDHPRRAVQHAVALLRRALTPAAGVTITRQATGYQLTADPDTIDLHRFDTLINQARTATRQEQAAALFEQALRLWHGEPFSGLDTPWLNTLRATLGARQQAARLDLTDIHLRQGRHAALLADLADQTTHHPLDERLAGQFLLALYRSGRQAQALEHYHRFQHLLAEELGVDPSPPLQQLHRQILTGDPAVATPTPASPPAAPPRPAPRQLPALPRLFTGRTTELRRLDAALDEQAETGGTMVISAIGGMGGIGKTWLALYWAHQHLDRFPDGQLHVNLRGFDPTGQPMTPATAVRGFLDTLGIVPAAIPTGLDAQVGLYRSLVAGKRMLIMLDNARDTAQVTPLLPGSPTCTVLVTSRHHLGGLVTAHGAQCVDLDVLPEAEARQVLTRQLGEDRITAEPGAVTELLACCAGLPLALGIVAARATRYPHFPLATLVAELRDESRRLDALDPGDPQATVRAALSWSTHALSEAATAAFGLLGLAPGPDIGLPAAAGLLAKDHRTAQALLRDLEHVSLIQQHAPARWRLHDLVRRYAANQATHELPADTRTAALRRVVSHYTHSAFAADRFLNPHRDPIDIDPPATDCRSHSFPDPATALQWFDAEHLCALATLHLAVARGWHTAVWQLAWTLDSFHHRRGHLRDNLTCWQAGVAAAEHLDEITRTQAHAHLGIAYSRLGQHTRAADHLGQAVTLAEHTGDIRTQARNHYGLALVWENQGDARQALTHVTSALRLYRALDDPAGTTSALNTMGWYHAHLGQYQQARDACERALALAHERHDRDSRAAAMDSLGYIAHHTGGHTEALDYYREALALLRDIGDAYHEADILARIGDVHNARGHHEEAIDAWRQARDLYRLQHRPHDADHIQRQLAALAPHADIATR